MNLQKRLFVSFIIFGMILTVTAQASNASTSGYYRFPTLKGNTLVFAAEGDLWIVDSQGGMARRLTTHAGEETNPAISPDGIILAFSASYEGPTELYTMPLTGGLPTRLTYEADSSTALGFTPDGQLLYTTRAFSTIPDPQLITIDLKTEKTYRIPLHQASDGSYDNTKKTLYFARPGFHNNNTARYKGGTARNIWKFTLGEEEAQNLTADFPGENFAPMWWNGRIYYGCDRSGSWNIWSMDTEGKDLKQHTFHVGWDVRSPSLDDGWIVYQLGADIRIVDVRNNNDRIIPITLASDFDQLRENWVENPMNYLTSAHVHPEGKSVVLTSRGRVFVAPAGKGRLVRASYKEGVRYRDAVFMPDGQTLLAISDESGELEFVTLPSNGVGGEKDLTKNSTILRFQGYPSPDGKWFAFDDKNNDLWIVNTENGKEHKVSFNREGIRDISWSPDSKWLAYSQAALNSFIQIHLYNLESGNQVPMTTDRINSINPSWSLDGKFIYFLSDRNLRSVVGSPWGTRQPEPYFDKPQKIFVLSLQKGVSSPFKPADELATATESQEKPKGEKKDVSDIKIDLEGIQKRIREVPVTPGNYGSLNVNDKALFWVERGVGFGSPSQLKAIPIGNKDPQVITVTEGIRGFEFSADKKKILFQKGSSLYVVDAAPRKISNLSAGAVDLRGWTFSIDVQEDFKQLFIDAWRLERDYFYDTGMHGLDWEAVRDKYLPLVKRVTTRLELNDLIGMVVGELSALHVSVRGGDLRRGTDQIRVATLGARLERDDAAGGYKIDHIYSSDPDYPAELSPLADPDLDVKEGDIIVSINGRSTLSVKHPNALLRNQAGRQVLVEIKSASTGNTEPVIVVPTGSESGLRYSDW